MTLDWLSLLEANSIEYVTSGPNTKRGEVSVKCPICGDDDPSEHMGISLTKDAWGCHRDATHRGKSPITLVAALLGCSHGQARLIVDQYSAPDPGAFDDSLPSFEPTSGQPRPVVPLSMPDEFRAIRPHDRFWYYLRQRGFHPVDQLVAEYQLKCALTGRYKDRIIIPFYQDGKLIGWTGRALGNPVNAPRYLSSGEAVKKTVFNEDGLYAGGELLFIVEGPFDAMKVDFYGQRVGARATCIFGTYLAPDQASIINRISSKFKKTVVLFDPEAQGPAMELSEWIPYSFVEPLEDVEDPGAMSEQQVYELVEKYKE